MTQLQISPTLEEFRAAAADPKRRVISVHTRVLVDDLTPVGVFETLCADRELTYLLESAEAGVWARWSFIGVNSASVLTSVDGQATWLGRPIEQVPTSGNPLEVLSDTLDLLHTPAEPGLPPFTSGMVGYLGYDCVRWVEQLPDSTTDDLGVPELMMMLTTDLAAFDHHEGELWLIANAINFDATTDRIDQAYADAVNRLEQMVATLSAPRSRPVRQRAAAGQPEIIRRRSDEQYQAMVSAAVEHIKAGDAFQIVPSQRFDVPVRVDPLDLYRELRRINPAPYLYCVRLPGFSIVGASPEALVTVKDGRASTNPIAGTRPRGATMAEDLRLEAELLSDPKERAEHIMLVDLGRNDLGRVCEPGSVEVTEFMSVGRHSQVMHLEARVEGVPTLGRNALDVTMSCFPAGTLSGAPKVRAMEIIDDLEPTRRGIYGGVVGYFDFAGNADTAIAIRTALVKPDVVHVQAGAGVVADSVPESENVETKNKAGAVLRAIGLAGGQPR